MIKIEKFEYSPGEHEAEKASNSYLMSVIALMAGLPLPVVNLLATFIFYMSYRRDTYFVRWHCKQALYSQLSLFFVNSFGVWWTISVIVSGFEAISNGYIAYMLIVLFLNLAEFIATVYTAIKTRKGLHVKWWFYGELTDLTCKP